MAKDLYGCRAKDLMTRDVVTVAADDTVHEAINLLVENRVSALPVVNAKGVCIGMLSTTDLIDLTSEIDHGLSEQEETGLEGQSWIVEQLGAALGDQKVAELMTQDVATVGPEEPIALAAREMRRHRIHRLPVVDPKGKLLGILSTSDLLDALIEHGPK